MGRGEDHFQRRELETSQYNKLVRPEHETLYSLEPGLVKVDSDGNVADERGAVNAPKTGLIHDPSRSVRAKRFGRRCCAKP